MAAVATINVDYAKISDFDQTIPLDQKPLNPLTLANYLLYNRDYSTSNYGINNHQYLAYEGGFLTQGDKVNFKKSDFFIRKSVNSTSGGNLSVSGSSLFLSNINLTSEDNKILNTAKNVRLLTDVTELNSTIYDKDAISLYDFKRFFYQPGMMVYYNGSWENLRDNMPFWRICAPPDSGSVVNVVYANGTKGSVVVPNLIGKFIPGASYNGSSYNIGAAAGVDAVQITEDQMPIHNHSIVVTVSGDERPVFSSSPVASKFYSGGGIITTTAGRTQACSVAYATCHCSCDARGCSCDCSCRRGADRACRNGCNCDDPECGDGGVQCSTECTRGASTIKTLDLQERSAVSSITIDSYTFKKLKFTTSPPTLSQSEQTLGSSLAHENRPKFYGLVPIIYVGVKR